MRLVMKPAEVTPPHFIAKGLEMRAYYNMKSSEFITELRYRAIMGGMPTAVIDQIDALVEAPSEEDIEKQCQEAREEGEKEGQAAQWEFMYDAIADWAAVQMDEMPSLVEALLAMVKGLKA